MKKVLLWGLGIAVTLVMIGGGIAAFALHNTTSKIHSMDSTLSQVSDMKTKAGKSVAYLLLGTDTGALGRNYKGRTDTMMVMVVNPTSKTTTMISIERDTKIQIDGVDAKLNAAYAYGNSEAAVHAVDKLLNIKLDGYLLVNMSGLKQLVNAVGGVDVKSPLTFDYEGYSFTEGKTYHMDGAQALQFSRMRYDDPQGDYGRQIRQQLVIESVINKLKNDPSSVLSNDFLNAVSDNVRSNISLNSLRNLATRYRDSAQTINRDQLKGTGEMDNGVSYQIISDSEFQRVHNEIENALNATE
ncbi:LCP family protein [Weissella confusa]|uniref:LCP family protein n=1 Tax=Weissella confusa TaxID=1583 RepID=A0A923NFU3_WEICO|nr:LCP family protein [Weissella confusa]